MVELPLVGDEFAGYRLRAVIGRGGMSAVYRAEHPQHGDDIALKVLAAKLAADAIFQTRFLAESRIAASMNDPHVTPIYDVGLSDGLLYIAMRRVAGTDLRQLIAEGGRRPPHTAVFLLSQAAGALDAAHRMGLVHRDVKPENLLIEWDDAAGSEHLYLADFGISRLGMTRNGLTSTGQFLGTVDYVAPEQISGPSVYGSADQYSLGCVLYECLTGRVPFAKDAAATDAPAYERYPRPTLLRTDLPPAVDEVFARVLAERPGDRYNTCREFMRAASVALGEMAIAPVSGGDSPAPRPRPAWATAGYQAAAAPAGYQPTSAYQTETVPTPGGYRAEGAPAADPERAASTEIAPRADGHRPRRGPLRARWLAIAAVLLLVFTGAGVGAYAGLSSKPSAQRKATGLTASAKAPKSPIPQRDLVSPLARVL